MIGDEIIVVALVALCGVMTLCFMYLGRAI